MIRLLVTDLDGTIVPHGLKLSDRTIEAIGKVKEKGILATIATGRMYASALPYIETLKIDLPVITYNGALVTDWKTQKVLREVPVDPSLVRDMLELCREKNWYIQAYRNDRLYVFEDSPKSRSYSHIAGVDFEAIGKDLWKVDSATKLLSIADHPEQQEEIAEAFQHHFGSRGNIAQSLGNYVEITDPQADKSIAIQFLCDELGFAMDEVMTLGDGGNDKGMLAAAGLGIAMGTSKEDVKAAANEVTLSAEEDGAALAIEKYLLG